MPTLDALTGIRFFAALLVLFHHFGGDAVAGSPWPVQNLVATGNLGVNLFYVLSGFIILYSYRARLDDEGFASKFMIARFARIYPVYLVSLALSFPLWLTQFADRKTGRELAAKVFVATASRLTLTQAWSGRLLGYWNPPSWSLSAEWFFYLLFALPAVRAAVRRGASRAGTNAAVMWLCTVAIGLAVWRLEAGGRQSSAEYSPVLHAPQFFLGVFLGLAWLERREPLPGWVSDLAALATVAVFVCAAWVPRAIVQFGSPAIAFGPLIFALASGRGLVARVLARRPIRFLGEASYAVYVLHWPIHDLQSALWTRLGLAPGPGFFWSYVVVVLVASGLAYRFFEMPARTQVRRWLEPRVLGRSAAAPERTG